MNERIQELGIEADIFGAVDINGYYDNEDKVKKFAELIVTECVETLKKDMELAHIQMIPIDFRMYANGRLQRTIKEHFGVEE